MDKDFVVLEQTIVEIVRRELSSAKPQHRQKTRQTRTPKVKRKEKLCKALKIKNKIAVAKSFLNQEVHSKLSFLQSNQPTDAKKREAPRFRPRKIDQRNPRDKWVTNWFYDPYWISSLGTWNFITFLKLNFLCHN